MPPDQIQVELVPGVRLPRAFFSAYPHAVSIMREDGVVLWRNPLSREMWAPFPSQDGFNLLDFGPGAFAAERVTYMRRLALAERSGVIRDVWKGKQILTHVRLLPRQQGEALRDFLLIHELTSGQKHAESQGPDEFFEPVHQDLGPLGLLSARELEVLSLVGEGLTAAQIAERLHRSEETVNTHRASLLKKLSCQNAVQLAVVAHQAGLKFSDGERIAVRKPGRDRPATT